MPSSTGALALALLSLACWGTWSNTAKAATHLPFALYYCDFTLGVFVTAAVVFITIGDGRVFLFEDGASAGGLHVLAALGAGAVFNLANVLLVSGVSLAGLIVAFPVGIGTALVLGTLLTFWIDPASTSYPALLFCGVAAAFCAIVVQVLADREHRGSRQKRDGVTELEHSCEVPHSDGHLRRAESGGVNGGGLGGNAGATIICAVSGVLMACWSPLNAFAMRTAPDGTCDGCLAPLGSSFLFTSAVLLTSPAICACLMRWPLVGSPTTFATYAKLSPRDHALGWLGGAIWAVGTVSNLLSGSKLGLALSYAIGQAAPMVASLWGLVYYREFAGASYRTAALVASMFVLYLAAIALTACSK